MMPISHTNRRFVLAAALSLLALACGKTDSTPAPDVSLSTTLIGSVLSDQDGKTLYSLAADVAGTPTCTGGCIDTWPVFYREIPTLGTGLRAADFKTITRADGAKQTTYKGWPLYTYKNDTKAGDTNGENVNNTWFVAKTNYSITIASGQLLGNDGKNYTSTYTEGTGTTLYFADSIGRTLYAFAPDKKNKNTYTKADLSNNATWPLYEENLREIPSTLNKADFSTITVFGRTQLTYKGWPLYYFGSDLQQRGSTKGVSVPRPGVWPIIYKTVAEAPVG